MKNLARYLFVDLFNLRDYLWSNLGNEGIIGALKLYFFYEQPFLQTKVISLNELADLLYIKILKF